MQRLLLVVILAIMVIGLPILVLSDTAIPTGNADILNDEVAGDVGETGNFTASATITIMMTRILGESLSRQAWRD